MANLSNFQARICYTVAGMLIYEGKVLLVKHKKLGIWLNPGGHIEPNELNHQAAEREFFEETGIRVKAVDLHRLDGGSESEFLPNPILTNLHWVSKENYWARVQSKGITDEKWQKGCEQHINFMYLVQPVAGVDMTMNTDETDGMQWFTPEEVKEIETRDNIRQEVNFGFELIQSHS
jgi:8-oxo-dGTP diphosphatase